MTYIVTIAAPLVGTVSNHISRLLSSFREGVESPFPDPLVRFAQVKVPVSDFLAWQDKHGKFIGEMLEAEPLGTVLLAPTPKTVELFDRQHWGFEVSAPQHVLALAEDLRLQLLTSEKVSTASSTLTLLQAGDCYASNDDRTKLHRACSALLAASQVELGKLGVYLHRTDHCLGSYVTSRPYAFPAHLVPFKAEPLGEAAPPFSAIEDKLAVLA